MKTSRISTLFFWAMLLGFLACVAWSSGRLPDRVATHFNMGGHPNAWMSRPALLVFITGLGLGVPCLLIALFYSVRFLPDEAINLPRRAYWLAKERRAETYQFIFRQSLWIAGACLALIAGVLGQLVDANTRTPPQLTTTRMLGLVGVFVVIVVVQIATLVHHFYRVPEDLSK